MLYSWWKWRELNLECTLKVELAGLAAKLDVKCMGKEGTKDDSAEKIVWKALLLF